MTEARRLTEALQEAVRTHDRPALRAMVDDRFVFSSTRVGGDIGKAGWIDWACAIDWLDFELGPMRAVELGDVLIVRIDVAQQVAGATPSRSDWIVSDVWARHGGRWRLVARHPEIRPSTIADQRAERR